MPFIDAQSARARARAAPPRFMRESDINVRVSEAARDDVLRADDVFRHIDYYYVIIRCRRCHCFLHAAAFSA